MLYWGRSLIAWGWYSVYDHWEEELQLRPGKGAERLCTCKTCRLKSLPLLLASGAYGPVRGRSWSSSAQGYWPLLRFQQPPMIINLPQVVSQMPGQVYEEVFRRRFFGEDQCRVHSG